MLVAWVDATEDNRCISMVIPGMIEADEATFVAAARSRKVLAPVPVPTRCGLFDRQTVDRRLWRYESSAAKGGIAV
jgi:hypothetical protein